MHKTKCCGLLEQGTALQAAPVQKAFLAKGRADLLGYRGCGGCKGGVKIQQRRRCLRREAAAGCILIGHRGGSAAWNLCKQKPTLLRTQVSMHGFV